VSEAQGAVPSGLRSDAGATREDGTQKRPAASELEGTELYDLRVSVDSIGGRAVCGLAVGDYFEVTDSSRLRLPPGGHFCLYALAAVLPLLPAKQRQLPASDWLESDCLVACPDPDERLIMRITRTGRTTLRSADLT
jgi:uncharacterized repeat protein (TIGR04076 family)